jgi:hypothetical protein
MKAKELIEILQQNPELEIVVCECKKYNNNISLIPITFAEIFNDKDSGDDFIILNFNTSNDKKEYKQFTPEDIVEFIINSFNISLNDIKGKSRKEKIRLPRQLIHTMLYIFTELTECQIALMTNNNRTTLYNSYNTIYQYVKFNLRYIEKIIYIFRYIEKYNTMKIYKCNNILICDLINRLKIKR